MSIRNNPYSKRKYESYGNRYLRSLQLPVRGSDDTTICDGNCSENTFYGDTGKTQLLEWSWDTGEPGSVSSELPILFAYYEVNYFSQCEIFLQTPSGPLGLTLKDVNGYDYIVPEVGASLTTTTYLGLPVINDGRLGFVQFGSPNGWFGGAKSLSFTNGTNNIPVIPKETFYFPHGNAWYTLGKYLGFELPVTNPSWTDPASKPGMPDTDQLGFLSFNYLPGAVAGRFMRMDVIDSDGNLLARSDGNPVAPGIIPDPPIVRILQFGTSNGYLVQSAKYPQVWYSVPTDYSSCDCGDFTQQVTDPTYAARSWVGSAAGPFNPCKHIMAVKRFLEIPQNYDDYFP